MAKVFPVGAPKKIGYQRQFTALFLAKSLITLALGLTDAALHRWQTTAMRCPAGSRSALKDDADEPRPSAVLRSLEENFLHEDKRSLLPSGSDWMSAVQRKGDRKAQHCARVSRSCYCEMRDIAVHRIHLKNAAVVTAVHEQGRLIRLNGGRIPTRLIGR